MDDRTERSAPVPWTVVARNLPEHARNPIHTDAGAQAAGFPRALVAGVTTYAYLTHPIVAAWGEAWLAHGAAEVRFRRPVFDHDELVCAPTSNDDGVIVEARTPEPDQPRALVRAWFDEPGSAAPSEMRAGDDLEPVEVVLEGEWGSDYGRRAGDDLTLYQDLGIVHPAVWPALANHVVHAQVAEGSWVHTRSIVRHHGLVPAGAVATVRSRVVQRFQAHGERAVLDVRVVVADSVVASLEHEAIVRLP